MQGYGGRCTRARLTGCSVLPACRCPPPRLGLSGDDTLSMLHDTLAVAGTLAALRRGIAFNEQPPDSGVRVRSQKTTMTQGEVPYLFAPQRRAHKSQERQVPAQRSPEPHSAPATAHTPPTDPRQTRHARTVVATRTQYSFNAAARGGGAGVSCTEFQQRFVRELSVDLA